MATTLSTIRLPRLRPLRASRERTLLRAVEAERRRFERDLHDGAQQRLIALRIHLGLAAERVADEPASGPLVLNELAHEAQEALDDLRQLVHRSQPASLEERGLSAALQGALDETPLSAHLDAGDLDRHEPEVEGAVYFICLEALQNALKHAGIHTSVAIQLRESGGRLRFSVSDTGPGFHASDASLRFHSGFANMRDRIRAFGGELSILSTPSRGTTVAGSLPSRRRSA